MTDDGDLQDETLRRMAIAGLLDFSARGSETARPASSCRRAIGSESGSPSITLMSMKYCPDPSVPAS